MKPELLEQYVLNARSNKTSDEQIKQELTIGGWNPADIDAALKNTTPNQKKAEKKAEVVYEVPHPIFFGAFLSWFVLFLVAFNIISYWGQIMGSATARPVTNTELAGGIILSFILALVIAGIHTGIKKLIRKFRNR